VSEAKELITSARRAAATCGVTRYAVRAWIDHGLLPEPPWTAQQLREVRDTAEAGPGPRVRTEPGHGDLTDVTACSVAKRTTTR
jgi:hypothetical protein